MDVVEWLTAGTIKDGLVDILADTTSCVIITESVEITIWYCSWGSCLAVISIVNKALFAEEAP